MPPVILAVGHYDRHMPLIEGSIKAEGVDLIVRVVGESAAARDGNGRNERMLLHGEFDAAEIGISPYVILKSRGSPFTAIPVFPRRLFSQSLVYCRRASGLQSPHDLIGRKVGIASYQNSLAVVFKGDLDEFYGVEWKKIRWVASRAEPIPFGIPPDVSLEVASERSPLTDLLFSGKIDALILPNPSARLTEGEPEVGPLFPDPRAEEVSYFRLFGYPIMHLVVCKTEIIERYPILGKTLYGAFEQSFRRARASYADPNWSILPWGLHTLREQEALLGKDLWSNGLEKNRVVVERFVKLLLKQGVIDRVLPVEELFHPITQDT